MPSTSVPEHDYIIFNLKFKPEIQNFTLGHEIGHVSWFRAAENKTEAAANTFSLHLIYRFSLNNNEEMLSIDNFEDLYSIPFAMKSELKELLKYNPNTEDEMKG